LRRGALLECYGAGDWHGANMKTVLANAANWGFCGEVGNTAGGAGAAAAAAVPVDQRLDLHSKFNAIFQLSTCCRGSMF
jgi:hypothetical protein